jgi:hypothetical protein
MADQPQRKNVSADPSPSQRLLTTRAALIVTLAVLVGLGGAGLLYLARFAPVLIVLGALSMFGSAIKLFDSLIELCSSMPGAGGGFPASLRPGCLPRPGG